MRAEPALGPAEAGPLWGVILVLAEIAERITRRSLEGCTDSVHAGDESVTGEGGH